MIRSRVSLISQHLLGCTNFLTFNPTHRYRCLLRSLRILLLGNVVPHIPSNQQEREHGFRASVFCPIPVGDSPSSKRMYDVINFGCIPVVLSDDLIWAFSDQSFGPFKHSSFALHLPQNVVQHSSGYLLETYRSKLSAMGTTLSGKLIYSLLEEGYKEDGDYINGAYVNPLVHILRRVPIEDINSYQMAGRRVAPYFRYYAFNSSMQSIPTASFSFPNGGALEVIVDHLTKRKEEGITKVTVACQTEKARTHKYQHRYPCENSVLRRRNLLLSYNETSRQKYQLTRLETLGYRICNLD